MLHSNLVHGCPAVIFCARKLSFGALLEFLSALVGVSSHCRLLRKVGMVNYGCQNTAGYLEARIAGKTRPVHRLVALAFLGPPSPARYQVNHKDGDRSNNHVDNFDYVSAAEHITYSYQNILERES